MNYYTFEELEIGRTESFQVMITAEMMEQFQAISGDCNPLHCDKKYAEESGFPDRVVYGMLTAFFLFGIGRCFPAGRAQYIARGRYKIP